MDEIKKSRKGSTLIPAVFLLLFILIFGAALVRGVLLSTSFSTQTLNKRQAYLLAESATNYICDTLAGTQTDPLFASINVLLEGIGVNTSIDAPVKIGSDDINTQIKLLSRTENGNKTNDVYKITSVASRGGISQSISREMTAERTKGGIGDLSMIGLFNGTNKARYNISGFAPSTPAEINGSARLENIEDIICTNLRVKGDLFIRGVVGVGDGVFLSDVEVEKNLYIGTSSPNNSIHVQLSNITAYGDIIINTTGVVSLSGIISANNMYIHATNGVIAGALRNCYAKNIYCSNSVALSDGIKNIITADGGTIHTGEEAHRAVMERFRGETVDPPLDITFTKPDDAEEMTSDDPWENIDLGVNTIRNIEYTTKNNALSGTLNVSGAGAVNIYVKIEANSSLVTTNFKVNRAEGCIAAVNIICLKNKAEISYNNIAAPLDANIIVPYGTVYLAGSSVNGVAIAGNFILVDIPLNKYYFNVDAKWSDFGGGLPGIGIDSVKFAYSKFVK